VGDDEVNEGNGDGRDEGDKSEGERNELSVLKDRIVDDESEKVSVGGGNTSTHAQSCRHGLRLRSAQSGKTRQFDQSYPILDEYT
jgi:hypothetical protein